MVATANYTCNRGFFNYRDDTHLVKPNNGIFYAESRTKIRDIRDGTSKTIAIGERTVLAAHRDDLQKWPSWCGPGGLGIGSTVSSCVSVRMNHPVNMHAFSSHHRGGAGFFPGFGKGTLFMLRRMLVGVTEVGTFFIPMEGTLPRVCQTPEPSIV